MKKIIFSFKSILFFAFIAFFLVPVSVFSQKTAWNKIEHKKIDTKKLDSLENWFNDLSAQLKSGIDSILKSDTTLTVVIPSDSSASDNISASSLALFSIGENGKFSADMTASCFCNQINDTLNIQILAGFMAGSILHVKVIKDKFTSSYIEYSDDVMLYKINKNDTALRKEIDVKNVKQKLYLTENSKSGKEICGEIETTSVVFYEVEFDSLKKKERLKSRTVSVKGKFKCKPKKI